MPWIQSHSVLRNHKKVRESARELNISRVQFIGHLHLLWHAVIDLAEDGDISCWTVEDIAYYAEWTGDSVQFFNAINGRFVDYRRKKGGIGGVSVVIFIHDWLDYAWSYLERKYHTSNPELLKTIKEKHKNIGCIKGKPKGLPKGCTQVPPNIIDVKDVKDVKDIRPLTFSKPSIEKIQEYCQARKNNISAESFYDFYESKGWKVGKTPMKDWQAAIRTWEQNKKQEEGVYL